MVDSLNGKVLRLDPATGNGVSSNPFYDPDNPRSERSRVWAMGFRNPWRIRRLDEPAWSDQYPEHPKPEDGKPGRFAVSDVGANSFEEVNIVDAAGFNGGWPHFEGFVSGPRAPGGTRVDSVRDVQSGCLFHQLLLDDHRTLPRNLPCTGRAIEWRNKYYGFAGPVPVFKHARPALAYPHAVGQGRYPDYATGGNAITKTTSLRLGGGAVTAGPSLGLDPAKGPWPPEWTGALRLAPRLRPTWNPTQVESCVAR